MSRSLTLCIALCLAAMAAGCTPTPTGNQETRHQAKQARESKPQAQVAAPAVALMEESSIDGHGVDHIGGDGGMTGYSSLVADQAMPVDPVNETYTDTPDQPIRRVSEEPVSTFSVDVDSGSYANVRRLLNSGHWPPPGAVRVEEMINYFDYGYPVPDSLDRPFSVSVERAPAPWNPQHELLLVGLKGYEVPARDIPAANLVFLIDTSGSMQDPDKLDLLRASFKAMVEELRPDDRVAIVAYAGSAGLVLPPTSGRERNTIVAALDSLTAGGSTNGGEGIELAYATAQAQFIQGGVNRVILATDGDFNVGMVSVDALKDLVARRRESGIALTTLGLGGGNYNDAMAEQLADIGHGNHAYIDTLAEGRRVLVDEVASTLLTIAQDVKVQVEFNPAVVAEYRLIGYANRQLRREDFKNDQVDAGDIGAGHDVTALYELALVGSGGESMEPLRYGSDQAATTAPASSSELGVLRLRYKTPGEGRSQLIEQTLPAQPSQARPSEAFRFATAVAGVGQLLERSTYLGTWGFEDAQAQAQGALGLDPDGYRQGFVQLIDRAQQARDRSIPQTSVISSP